MTDTLKSVVEEELQKAYERGVQDGMRQERALWELTKIGQEIELGISYEEANPPEPHCKRCGKKLGTEAYDVHTCTPKEKVWVGMTDDIGDRFAHRLAIMLECMCWDANSNYNEACALLDEYHKALRERDDAMGIPYVSGFGKD